MTMRVVSAKPRRPTEVNQATGRSIRASPNIFDVKPPAAQRPRRRIIEAIAQGGSMAGLLFNVFCSIRFNLRENLESVHLALLDVPAHVPPRAVVAALHDLRLSGIFGNSLGADPVIARWASAIIERHW